MINVTELGPCKACGRSVSMVMPGKDELWYITCTKCQHHTNSYEDAEEARAEWDDPDAVVQRPEPKVKSKPKAKAKPKARKARGASKSAVVRAYIGENPDMGYDELLAYAETLGFNTRPAAVSCVRGNLKLLGVTR